MGDEPASDSTAPETVKSLLEEANRMLKVMTATKSSETEDREKNDKLSAMQIQLDELRKMKVLRLSRISREEVKYGLLDSGTHPMRGARGDEDISHYETVQVVLADGKQVAMKMSPHSVMVMEKGDVEPIVPMSLLAGKMGYSITWEGGRMKVTHPRRADIRVTIANGCPQISKTVALKLIGELESEKSLKAIQVVNEEEEWLRGLTLAHPALRTLPEEIRKMLVVTPAEDLRSIPGCNRRQRRTLEQKGFTVHLYAGEATGYTMTRALKECGGDCKRLVEIDIWKLQTGIYVCQESYVRDVLKRNGEEHGRSSGVPVTKDQVAKADEVNARSSELVRSAQKVTGELMWVGTKTRPDLMYVLAQMSQNTLKSPAVVVDIAAQTRRYLQKTIREGLFFEKTEDDTLEVLSDSSYGPAGMDSQGAVVVMWGHSPMMWRAGKQATPSLSTAKSELGEAIEGLVMGDAVDCMIKELTGGGYGKVVKIDNQAACSLLAEASGSWRTRHLRLRASHLRWRLTRADWVTEADIGTKVMTAPKLSQMRQMIGVKLPDEIKKIEEEEQCEELNLVQNVGDEVSRRRVETDGQIEKVAKLIQLAVIMECVGKCEALGEGEEVSREFYNDVGFLVILLLALIGLMSLAREVWTRRRTWGSTVLSQPSLWDESLRNPVREESYPGQWMRLAKSWRAMRQLRRVRISEFRKSLLRAVRGESVRQTLWSHHAKNASMSMAVARL